jgi:signal transduction histidine kinase
MPPNPALLILGTVTGVVFGLVGFALVEVLYPNRGDGTAPGLVGFVVASGTIGLVLSIVHVYVLRRLVLGPMGSLSESLRKRAETMDYSEDVADVGVPVFDALVAELNRMIAAIRIRDETIDRHELMERNLQDWMKKRSFYELELEDARLAAEDANQTKSRFLASVSHELRTPLHTVINYARFGARDTAEGRYEETAEYFEVIMDSSDLLLLLLNDLLNLSKLESGKMSFNPTPARLGDLVGCAADHFQIELKKRGLEVVLNVQEPDLVFVDPARTLQVVRNLIENAIKYSRANSSIIIDVYPEKDNVILRVRDQGEGVPESELESIFDSFKKASNVRSAPGGVGLGLAIARQIVLAHHGRIWAENHEENGLVVFVQLAAHDVEIEARAETSLQSDDSQMIDRTSKKGAGNVY